MLTHVCVCHRPVDTKCSQADSDFRTVIYRTGGFHFKVFVGVNFCYIMIIEYAEEARTKVTNDLLTQLVNIIGRRRKHNSI